MARRVYLHIGAPKTGSTYVQNVLWNNHSVLNDAGFLLPGSAVAQDQAMADLRAASWRDADVYWTWDRLAAKARKWPGDVIISNEGLGAADDAQAARAVESLQPAEVHVIAAGRDLWRTFPSFWQQSIRARSGWRFGAFMRAVEQGKADVFWSRHTAPHMLRRWGDLVPAERRYLVTVPPAGAPRHLLWRRFAQIMGIPDGLCELAEPTSNPSLGAAEIELLRRVNLALGDSYPLRTPYQKVVHRHLVDAVLKERGNELKFGVGLDRAEWVRDLAEQQIKELQDYPCQVVGDLDELRPTTMRQTTSPDELDDGQLLRVAVETIVGMLGHAESLDRRADRQPEEVLSRLRARAAGGVKRRLRLATRRDT
ncbi:hypothetical protein SAMN05443287_11576 [Micromonospora phaseoli]|uniref:Sulfotransferase family protein n=1 Tax=Micromonospora phaseoli TaxID=1144548 RepID=A0A1H7DP02_9ACTN|nr:hypothetical protein [Micromonospora phaseoli]PZV89476.1 hypothetical protein CLV64_11577 [Micromonospora phaseoli]GIJ80610.1 hypothetical protein Xph01_50420 [Micromonospora phaseoli]SEK03114.1 hypothetical protein SAMN05443287_11576 [Micromonospora phaseoli]